MKWIGQHIWDFISRFRNDVYLEKLDSTPATTVLVVEADGKVGTNEGIGTSDVDSVTTTDGTYIDMTPNVPTVGAKHSPLQDLILLRHHARSFVTS